MITKRLLPAILFGCVLPVLASPALADSLPDTITHIKPSIVGVGSQMATRTPPINLSGTGFVVADGHYVITNAHVITKVLEIESGEKLGVVVRQNNRTEFREATVITTDSTHDLALLHISGPALPAMTIGESGTLREGEDIAFTGFPIGMVLGLQPVTHRGSISAITPIVLPALNARLLNARMVKNLNDGEFNILQLDATAYPGNSGSPVFDPATGKVLGIINMVFVKTTKEAALAEPSGISYAIPAKFARQLLQDQKLLK